MHADILILIMGGAITIALVYVWELLKIEKEKNADLSKKLNAETAKWLKTTDTISQLKRLQTPPSRAFFDENGEIIDFSNLPEQGVVRFSIYDLTQSDFEWRSSFILEQLEHLADVKNREIVFSTISDPVTGGISLRWETRPR